VLKEDKLKLIKVNEELQVEIQNLINSRGWNYKFFTKLVYFLYEYFCPLHKESKSGDGINVNEIFNIYIHEELCRIF